MKMMTDVFICPSTGWGVFLVYPILKKPKFGADNSAIAVAILSWRR